MLEHLTLAERLDVLALARRVVRRDGVIVVCEAPNRLIGFDHHTTRLPYFAQLPDDLALLYARHSERGEFKAAIGQAAGRGDAAGREALARWGRGVSYHEFELAFGDLRSHVLACNYDPLLMGVRPVHAEEARLARGLGESRPDLAPVFGRYWQDLILSPIAVPGPRTHIRPWRMDTLTSSGVGYSPEEMLHFARGARLHVRLPVTTRELMVGVKAKADAVEVEARASTGETSAIAKRIPGQASYVMLRFDRPHSEFEIRLDQVGFVNFVGYRG